MRRLRGSREGERRSEWEAERRRKRQRTMSSVGGREEAMGEVTRGGGGTQTAGSRLDENEADLAAEGV